MTTNQSNDEQITENLLEIKSLCPEVSTSNTTDLRLLTTENGVNDIQKETSIQQLETKEEYRLRKKSHYVVHITTFITSIGFSIVLTGVWPYLKQLEPSATKETLGWVVSLNPLGQMIASPILGWLGNRHLSNRYCLLITMLMFVAGNLLYAVLPLFKKYALPFMLLSRFIVGISSANIAVCRAYISVSTLLKERTGALATIAAAQSMGYILGPSIQTGLAYICPFHHPLKNVSNVTYDLERIAEEDTLIPRELSLFNMFSLTGWLTAILGFLNLFILMPCIYQEYKIAEREERYRKINQDASGFPNTKTDYSAVGVLVFTYFSILLVYVLLETLIVPLCLDLYAWTAEFTVKVAGIGITVSGVITLAMFILGGKLAKKFGDRKVFIIAGLIPLTLSMLMFFPIAGEKPQIKDCLPHYNSSSLLIPDTNIHEVNGFEGEKKCNELGCPASQEWCFYTPTIHASQMIGACLLLTLGYPIGVSLAGAIFSKMLKAKRQGLWMGVLTSSGSLSRFLGPLFVSYLYTSKGPLWTFATLFVLFSFVIALNVIFYRKMKPLSSQSSPKRSPS